MHSPAHSPAETRRHLSLQERTSQNLPRNDSLAKTEQSPAAATPLTATQELRRLVIERLAELGNHMRLHAMVTVERGEVTVCGSVDSNSHRLVVVTVVSRVPGVQKVHDRLSIHSRFHAENEPASRPGSRRILQTVIGAFAALSVLLGASLTAWSQMAARVHAVPVQVNYHGAPAEGAILTLHAQPPLPGDAPRPYGRVRADGSVEWTTFDRGDGLPPGDYRLSVRWEPLVLIRGEVYRAPNPLSPDYQHPDRTPLRLTVSASAFSPATLELK